LPGLFAGVLLWLLGRTVREPVQIFMGIALSILLFSFTAPLGLATIPDNVRIFLVLMHIITAGAIGGTLYLYATN
jgi:hypothetical protein